MRTIFLARGPSFRRGVVVPPITNVDIYPLLMSLLGLSRLRMTASRARWQVR